MCVGVSFSIRFASSHMSISNGNTQIEASALEPLGTTTGSLGTDESGCCRERCLLCGGL